MTRQILDQLLGTRGGTVSSVGLTVPSRQTVTGSPVTGSGTLVVTDNVQAANAVFAGPASGASAAPTFRALVAADIPGLTTYLPLAGGTMSGQILTQDGGVSTPPVSFAAEPTTGFWRVSAGSVGFSILGSQTFNFDATGFHQSIAGGGTAGFNNFGEGTTQIVLQRASANATSSLIQQQKARGTLAAPAAVALNDILATWRASGYTGAAFTAGVNVTVQVIETGAVGAAAMGTSLRFATNPIGSVTNAEVARFENGTGFSMFGANPVIDANRLFVLRNFTVSTLPATPAIGATAFVTDATLGLSAGLGLAPIGGGTNKVPVYYDGAWKIG